jgi:hypothetical protein
VPALLPQLEQKRRLQQRQEAPMQLELKLPQPEQKLPERMQPAPMRREPKQPVRQSSLQADPPPAKIARSLPRATECLPPGGVRNVFSSVSP